MADTGWTLEPASGGWTLEPADEHGALATGAHYAAKALPAIGGFLGAIPGGAAGAAVGAPTGPGALATTAVGAGIGAGMGAAAGRGLQHVVDTALGYEKPIGDAEELKNKVSDMAEEGLASGAATAIGTGAIGAARPLLSKLAGPLERLGLAQAKRVLTGGANTLRTTNPISDEAAREAFEQGAIRPLGTTQGAAKTLDAAREGVGDVYERIVKALKASGVTGPEADLLAEKYTAEESASAANTMNRSVPAVYGDAADQLAGKPTVNGRLDLEQAENLKRSMQGMAKSAYKQLQPDELAQAHEHAASMMRQAVEDEIATQTQGAAPAVKAIGDQFVPVKQQLGRIIEASNAADRGAAQASARRLASPSDYIAAATGGAPAAIANHIARTRGTSTAAWAALSASDKLSRIASANPAALGRYGAILSKALQEGDQSFAAHTYALSQTDPQFQAMSQKLEEQ